MGLRGEAAIVGFHELPAVRKPTGKPEFTIEQWARLAAAAVADAGLRVDQVDGLVTTGVFESEIFVPSTVVEYLGLKVNFAEHVDLGGASAGRHGVAGRRGRSNWASATRCCARSRPTTSRRCRKTTAPTYGRRAVLRRVEHPIRLSAGRVRDPVRQPRPERTVRARWPRCYAAAYGYDERAMAKIVVDQRVNANHTPARCSRDKPITIEDVLASPIIAEPLHMLEIVMPCIGGAAVVVASADVARRGRNRPVWIKGFGERVAYKTPTYAEDLLHTPIAARGRHARSPWPGRAATEIDMVSIYDCYTITVLLIARGRRLLREGQGHGVRRRPRPDLPRRLPAEHRRRPARLRPGRAGRRHAPRRATPPARSWAGPATRRSPTATGLSCPATAAS